MLDSRMQGFLALALLGLALAVPLAAQSGGGTIAGRVTGADGAGLPGVTVTATDVATGRTRVTQSDAIGTFRMVALPVGTYDVTAELAGYLTVKVEGLHLNVATTRELDVQLRQETVEETIIVSGEAPLVRTSPAIGTVVSTEELESLPLNGRQFATLASLAPGTTLGINPDPTKVGKLVIGLNGGSGRNVNFLIDGGDNTDDTIGGQLQNFSLESVAEFSVQTQQYKAEFGRTTGGVVTVVTKSGANTFDGSVFGFLRDDSLNEKTTTEERSGAEKPSFERQQYGFSLGGPIAADRTHFFVTAERFDQDAPYTVFTDGVFPQFDGQSFPIATEDDLITAKVTHTLSPKQYLQVRYGYQKTETSYGAATTVTPDALGALTNDFDTLLAGHNAVIGASAVNEARIQYSEFENLILPVTSNPTEYFPSGVQSGQNVNTPQATIQEKLQLKDDFSFTRTWGRQSHDFKTGVEYVDEDTLGGFLAAGTEGQFTHLGDDPSSPITDIIFFSGDFRFDTPNEQWRLYVQDDWRVSDRLTVNLGLRYEYTDILELDQRSNPLWQALAAQTTSLTPILDDFRGGAGGVIDADDDDLAPRLGFTWDVKGDGKQLLRGGWGLYHDFPYSNATVLFPSAAVQSEFGISYLFHDGAGIRNADGSFFQIGDPLPPNQIPGGTGIAINEVASPTLSTPHASQASLGWSFQATPWLGLNVEAVTIRYRDLPFRYRANPIDPATGQRLLPQFGNFRLWYGEGEASYDGLNLGFHGRGTNFDMQGFYTYSEAEGNILGGADEFRLTATEHQPDLGGARDVSVDPIDPLCNACFGPLNTDARHRVTLAGTYRLPAGFQVAALFRYRSALPYTEHAGQDLNGDGFNLDLPAGVDHVNSRRGASLSQLDLRVSKLFAFGGDFSVELIGEVFNVFDEDNPVRFVGNRSAGNFGEATTFAGDPGQGEQRLAQLGVRFRF